MAKTLNTNVAHGGVWYRPGQRAGQEIPTEVADEISNPKVWDYSDSDEPEQPAGEQSTTGAELVKRVAVDGVWYGPGDKVPDGVARRISNPKVWKDGNVPSFDDADEAERTGEPDGQDGQDDAGTADSDDTTDAGDDTPAEESRPRRGRRNAAA